MTYIFNARKDQPLATPEEEVHPLFSARKKEEPGKPYQPVREPQKPMTFGERTLGVMKEQEEEEREQERHIARGYSRIGERILGLPGDIKQFINTLTGSEFHSELMPTSANLQQASEYLTGGYTSPKSPMEKKSDEFLGDVASMMIPGGPAKTTGGILGRMIGVPLIGHLSKEGIEKMGGEEGKANLGKMGTMLALDLIFARRNMTGGRGVTGSPKDYVNSLFSEVDNALPAAGVTTNAVNLNTELKGLKTMLQRGGTSPTTSAALTKIDEAQQAIKNGQIDVRELPAFRKNINSVIDQLGGWQAELPPKLKAQAITNLGKVKKAVIKAGEEYGRTQNPEFLKFWQSANESAAVLSKSNVIANFIQKTFGKNLVSNGAKVLFGLSGTGALGAGAKMAPIATAATATAAGSLGLVYQAGKVLYRIIQSPTLRNYYTKTITSALNGEKSIMTHNLAKLDKELKDKEEKEKALIEKLKQERPKKKE